MSGRGPRGSIERPVMREAFRKELRSRLLTEAAVVLAPQGPRPFFLWPILRPALAVAALALIVAWGTTSAAAASLPGDPLYGVKLAAENVQVALTFDDVARMQLLNSIADRRLEELAKVAELRPDSAPTATAEYADAVDRFADAVDKLRDADSEDKRDAAQAVAEAAREKHKAVLDAIKPQLPEDDRPAVDQVIQQEQERTSPSDGNGGGGNNGNGRGRPANSAKPTPKR